MTLPVATVEPPEGSVVLVTGPGFGPHGFAFQRFGGLWQPAGSMAGPGATWESLVEMGLPLLLACEAPVEEPDEEQPEPEPEPTFPPVEYVTLEGRSYETAIPPVVRTIAHEADRSAYVVKNIGSYAGVQGGVRFVADGVESGSAAWGGGFQREKGEDGKRIDRDVLVHRAIGEVHLALADLQATTRLVVAKRIQVTYVEVDAAYSDAEAEHAAFQVVEEITDAEWAAGVVGYRCGFNVRSLPPLQGGTPVV